MVAPLLWCALFGLPGMVFYKAVNTADSMIGHRTPRHGGFGWASARLDDLVNLPASRLAAVWIALAAARPLASAATPFGSAVRSGCGCPAPVAQRGLAGGGDGGRRSGCVSPARAATPDGP